MKTAQFVVWRTYWDGQGGPGCLRFGSVAAARAFALENLDTGFYREASIWTEGAKVDACHSYAVGQLLETIPVTEAGIEAKRDMLAAKLAAAENAYVDELALVNCWVETLEARR